MTKETPRTRTYRVQVDYHSNGRDRTTVFVLASPNRRTARETGRGLFDGWVVYNQKNGYGDFTDLAVTRVTCAFVGSTDA